MHLEQTLAPVQWWLRQTKNPFLRIAGVTPTYLAKEGFKLLNVYSY